MNHNYYVPEFDSIDESGNPAYSRTNKSPAAEEDMMELLWQDGQVVFHSQNQRSQRKHIGDAAIMPEMITAPRQIRPEGDAAANLFMQEDEMTNWLHYPLDDTPFDRDLYDDLLYPPNCTPASIPACLGPDADHHKSEFKPPKPPTGPVHRKMTDQGGPSVSNTTTTNQPKVVDSSNTPALGKAPESGISHVSINTIDISPSTTIGCPTAALAISSAASVEPDARTCDFTLSSSPDGSSASPSASVEPTTPKPAPPVIEDRKRKERATADDADRQNKGIKVNHSDVKQRVRGSTTSTKKSRAAEVHNLSERKRRDRINEKMKALQELIPRCNKSDKASMLDEAIEYLKSLQLQVQMMSMGCTMVPMMFPGIQHYMPTVGMGMGIGSSMGMPFPPYVHHGSIAQGQASTSHMAPMTFPLPPPGAMIQGSNRIQATKVPDSVINSVATQNLSYPHLQNNFVDPYQQFLNMNLSQASMLPQNQTVMQPNTSVPNSSNHGKS